MSDVADFCLARLDEDVTRETSPYGLLDLANRRTAVAIAEATEDLDALGSIAALHAYHPDYQNWPAHDLAEHQNTPATYTGLLAGEETAR